MIFVPYVMDSSGNHLKVDISLMTPDDAKETTDKSWQTSWESEYLSRDEFLKYSFKCNEELIALAAYEVFRRHLVVHIVYMEAHPESNPTFRKNTKKYFGIGKLLIAYGIKLSVDYGLGGDVVLEAKTSELEKHYVSDFGAVKLPIHTASAPRYLIANDAAKNIFFSYLE